MNEPFTFSIYWKNSSSHTVRMNLPIPDEWECVMLEAESAIIKHTANTIVRLSCPNLHLKKTYDATKGTYNGDIVALATQTAPQGINAIRHTANTGIGHIINGHDLKSSTLTFELRNIDDTLVSITEAYFSFAVYPYNDKLNRPELQRPLLPTRGFKTKM